MVRFQCAMLLIGSVIVGLSACKPRKKNQESQDLKAANVQVIPARPDEPFFVPDPKAIEKNCKLPTVKTAESMPKDHTDPAAGAFSYRYEYVQTDEQATTVVFFPGGPGGDSIGKSIDYLKNFPQMNLLLIDPRGVGCNFQGEKGFKLKELTSEQHAQDVVEVIKRLNLKKYIIYGISYGTLVGTVAAAAAEQAGYPPKALVLEGIIGKPFTKGVRQTFDVEFEKFSRDFPTIPPHLVQPVLPLGLTPLQWGKFFNALAGYSRQLEARIFLRASKIVSGSTEEEVLKYDILDLIDDKLPIGGKTFYAAVACRELLDANDVMEFELDRLEMKIVRKPLGVLGEVCGPRRQRVFYDSANYQVQAPIYYFQGENDPNTPLAQAQEHFKAQKQAKMKYWTTVAGGSHTPLIASDQLEMCSRDIWKLVDQLETLGQVIGSNNRCVNDPGPSSISLVEDDDLKSIDFEAIRAAKH